MERKGKTMWRQYKKYGAEFRRRVVDELMSGSAGYSELTDRYGLSGGLLTQWVKRYGGQAPVEDEEADTRVLRARLAELERMVGRLTMENDFLKKFAAYTKQQTNERLSIVTPKNWEPPRPAGSLGLPAARTTTGPQTPVPRMLKTPGSKGG
jgi:transposase